MISKEKAIQLAYTLCQEKAEHALLKPTEAEFDEGVWRVKVLVDGIPGEISIDENNRVTEKWAEQKHSPVKNS